MFEVFTEPPVERIELPSFENKGVELFIKREDLLHPFISGNKWRKLKYVFEDAQQQNKSLLVSFGGAYSNHLVALAHAAHAYGFQSYAFIRGEEVSNHMLEHCRKYGMQLQFVTREAYRDKKQLFETQFQHNAQAYFIDEGGRGALAAKGCEAILNQIENYTHVFCAVGTGTTLAGIARAAQHKSIVAEGVLVLKGAESILHDVKELAGYEVKIHTQFHRGGYAKTDEELIQFIYHIHQCCGFWLDQVYTAKCLMAIVALIDMDYFARGSKIVMIHTGGLLGNTGINMQIHQKK